MRLRSCLISRSESEGGCGSVAVGGDRCAGVGWAPPGASIRLSALAAGPVPAPVVRPVNGTSVGGGAGWSPTVVLAAPRGSPGGAVRALSSCSLSVAGSSLLSLLLSLLVVPMSEVRGSSHREQQSGGGGARSGIAWEMEVERWDNSGMSWPHREQQCSFVPSEPGSKPGWGATPRACRIKM